MKEFNLSDQALGAIMMALQKAILEQSDVTELLRSFRFRLSEIGLVVMNSPLVKFADEDDEDDATEDA